MAGDLLWALKNTLLQAAGSSFFTVVFGLWAGMGLLWARSRVSRFWFRFLELLFVLPSLLPSLFVLISCLTVIDPFPFGRMGVILVHTLMNVGFVGFLFQEHFETKLAAISELALIEGASVGRFFRFGVLGSLQSEILSIFLFLFSLYLGSFSIPLMVGGQSGTTLEVYIYEKLVIEKDWSTAVTFSLIQVILLLTVLAFLPKKATKSFSGRHRVRLELLESWGGLCFPLFSSLLILLPPLLSFKKGFHQLGSLGFNGGELIEPLKNTLFLSLGGGLTFAALSFLFILTMEFPWCRRFLSVYQGPPAVIVGILFFGLSAWLGPWFKLPVELQLILGFIFIYYPALFRMGLGAHLKNWGQLIEVSQVLGATPWKTTKEIVWPLAIRPIAFISGVGSMWVCGDFALSSMLTSQDFHLGLWAKSLAGSYRLDAAGLLLFCLYLISFLIFLMWRKLGDVLSRKY